MNALLVALALCQPSILGSVRVIVTRSVSEDKAAIHGIPRLRFGLQSLPPTLILKFDGTQNLPSKSQEGLKIEIDRPVPVLLTSGKLKKTLDQPLSFRWKRLTLRQVLNTFREEYRISILRDRRIDPDRKLDGELEQITLLEGLKNIAQSASAEAGLIGNTIYFGPPESLKQVQKRIENCREQLFENSKNGRLSRERLAELLGDRQTIHWNDLDRPADLVQTIAERFKLKVKGINRVPHDLWAGATLPAVNACEALTLVLFQFDLSFRFNDDATAVEIVPVPKSSLRER